jgi:hypothetical protein
VKKLYQHVNKINFMMLSLTCVNIVNKVKSTIKQKINVNTLQQIVMKACTLILILVNVQLVHLVVFMIKKY